MVLQFHQLLEKAGGAFYEVCIFKISESLYVETRRWGSADKIIGGGAVKTLSHPNWPAAASSAEKLIRSKRNRATDAYTVVATDSVFVRKIKENLNENKKGETLSERLKDGVTKKYLGDKITRGLLAYASDDRYAVAEERPEERVKATASKASPPPAAMYEAWGDF